VALVADQGIDRPGIVEDDDGDAAFPAAPAQTIDTAFALDPQTDEAVEEIRCRR
jgi:hypothetical protein